MIILYEQSANLIKAKSQKPNPQMKRNNFEIEICTDSIQSVIEAQKGGANRVELCESICEGGTTPSLGLMTLAKQLVDIDVFALIRPRGGNFVYNPYEVQIMIEDIKAAVKIGIDGIVIGCLTSDDEVDIPACKQLISAANNLPITFHRAFDVCKNPIVALQQLKELGVRRILTSGQQNKAIDGLDLLTELNAKALPEIKIMVGSGVDETNILSIAKHTGIKSFHASLRVEHKETSIHKNTKVLFNCTKDIDEYNRKITDHKRVEYLIKILTDNELQE